MRHTTKIQIPVLTIGKEDVVFSVRKNGNLFGRLKISKGTVVWLPTNKRKAFRLNWEQFARLAKEHGTRGDFPD